MIKTAILVFILIVIAVAIFYFGLVIGGWMMGKRLIDATSDALDDSDLTNTQKINILEKIHERVKQEKRNYETRRF